MSHHSSRLRTGIPTTSRWRSHPNIPPFTASPQPPTRNTQCRALLGLDRLFKGRSSAPSQQQPLFDVDGPDLEPEFQSWLRSEGLSTQPLLLRHCGREGRGLVASRSLSRGEVLVKLPDHLVITAERAAGEVCMAPLLRNLTPSSSSSSVWASSLPASATGKVGSSSSSAAATSPPSLLPLPEWSLLALLLAEVKGRLAAGDRSSPAAARWGPYVAVLPQRPGTLLDWPAKEVQQLLRGSPLQRLADSITSAASASWRELEPLIAQGRADGLVPEHVPLSKGDLEWAFGVLLSRCIRLPSRGDLQVLAPWADQLNHDVSAEEGCHLDWSWDVAGPAVPGGDRAGGATKGALVLRADRPYAAGQQVYVSYGPKSSGELLLSYGFCPPPASNPHQDCRLRVAVDRQGDPLADLKEQALARHGLPSELEFPLKLEGIPEGLLQYLAFLDARPKVAQETFELASVLFESGGFPLLDGQDTLVLALRGLSNRCTAALKAYPTSMEADQALAAGALAAVTNRQQQQEQQRRARAPARARNYLTAESPPAASPSLSSPDAPPLELTLGTEDVFVSSVLRSAAVASIRVRERQIVQRTLAAVSGQLVEAKRAAGRSRRR